jgi:Tfp pilus assembly protein PilO
MAHYLFSKPAQVVTLVLLALVLAGFWNWAVLDEKSILANSAERLDSERLEIQRMELEQGKIESVARRYRQNLAEIEHFRDELIARKDERLLRISRFLDVTARAHNVHLERVSYQSSPSRQKALENYEIELPLQGRYRDIRAFIGDVERSELFLIITELRIEDDADRSGSVEMQLSLATYFAGGAP